MVNVIIMFMVIIIIFIATFIICYLKTKNYDVAFFTSLIFTVIFTFIIGLPYYSCTEAYKYKDEYEIYKTYELLMFNTKNNIKGGGSLVYFNISSSNIYECYIGNNNQYLRKELNINNCILIKSEESPKLEVYRQKLNFKYLKSDKYDGKEKYFIYIPKEEFANSFNIK